MKVLVFGQTGQVATEIQRRCAPDVQVTALGRGAADLADPAACSRIVEDAKADVIVNAAAWTAVDRAESEWDMACLVNGQAPTAMASAAARRGLPFVHLSTDYVFDGQGTAPFAPDSPVAPQNAYGRTKLLGEQGVQAAGGPHAILRTSWVFSAHGSNFVKTMLRLGRERTEISVVSDQVGGPTPAMAIADACIIIAKSLVDGAPSGTYHLSGSPDTSWAGFAQFIMRRAGLSCRVVPIPTSAFPTPAPRPLNSRLDCRSLQQVFGISRPDWRRGLEDILRDLGTLSPA